MLKPGRTASALPPGATSHVELAVSPPDNGTSESFPPDPAASTDGVPLSRLPMLTIAKLPLVGS